MAEGMEGEVVDVVALQGSNIEAAATMAAPAVGAEEPVVGQERWEQLHRLKAEGMTVSGIARAIGSTGHSIRGVPVALTPQATVQPLAGAFEKSIPCNDRFVST